MPVQFDHTASLLVRSEPGRRCGISDTTVPGSKILMEVLTLGSGEELLPGNAEEAETAAFVLGGRAQLRSVRTKRSLAEVAEGDFYFTPARLPYSILNPHVEPLRLVLAYSLDPGVTSLPPGRVPADAGSGVKVVRNPQDAGATAQTRGMTRRPAISYETVGATQVWMCSLTVQPNTRGQPHHHGNTHTAAYTISGRARICFGKDFEQFIEPGPGDFAFDPPELEHLVDHLGPDEPWKGVLARCPENVVVNVGQ